MISLIQEISSTVQLPPVLGWLYAFISFMIYNLYRLDQCAEEFDKNKDGYSKSEVARWLKKHWVKLTIAGLLLIVGILEMQTIWQLFFPGREFSTLSYFLAGFLSVALQYIMDKYDKK